MAIDRAQRRNPWLIVAVLVSSGALGVQALRADDPPDGPVAPTMKTLNDVEPATPLRPGGNGHRAPGLLISSPGSYFLTGNLAGTSGNHGIEIASDNVTLDLRGFSVVGTTGSLDGITVTGTRNNIVIVNGVVRGWAGDGIDAFNGTNVRVEGIVSSNNTGDGIKLRTGIVADSASRQNTGDGIEVSNDSIVKCCTVQSNSSAGIRTAAGCLVIDCTAGQNGGSGYVIGPTNSVRGSVARSNGGRGFLANNFVAMSDCVAANNGGGGASAGAGCLVVDTVACNNSNASDGLFTDGDSTLFDTCVASFNADDGIVGFSVRDCVASANADNGILSNAITGGWFNGNHVVADPGEGLVTTVDDYFMTRNFVFGPNATAFILDAQTDSARVIPNPGLSFSNLDPTANFRVGQ